VRVRTSAERRRGKHKSKGDPYAIHVVTVRITGPGAECSFMTFTPAGYRRIPALGV
jgi:hypothetical protein